MKRVYRRTGTVKAKRARLARECAKLCPEEERRMAEEGMGGDLVLAKILDSGQSFPMKREFNVVIERDTEGYYVASVPELHGCHTQARSLDKLQNRIREAIELCLEVEGTKANGAEFVGVQRIAIEV